MGTEEGKNAIDGGLLVIVLRAVVDILVGNVEGVGGSTRVGNGCTKKPRRCDMGEYSDSPWRT